MQDKESTELEPRRRKPLIKPEILDALGFEPEVRQIIDWRLEGKSLHWIGEQTGKSPEAVSKIVKRATTDPFMAETVEGARRMDIMRCEELINALWPDRGDHKTAAAIVKVMGRKAKLQGTDVPPTKTEDPTARLAELLGCSPDEIPDKFPGAEISVSKATVRLPRKPKRVNGEADA